MVPAKSVICIAESSGNLTEWDCTNADHRPVIFLHVDRMRREPVGRRNEANSRRPERPPHGRNVRRYCVMVAAAIIRMGETAAAPSANAAVDVTGLERGFSP